MRRLSSVLVAAGLAAVVLALVAERPGAAAPTDAGPADAAADAPVPACVHVSTVARYVPGGYNHVVILANACEKRAVCNVATDVNPQPQVVQVASGASTEVLTWMASPASTFVARVACVLR